VVQSGLCSLRLCSGNVFCNAFGDPLLLRQKGAKPSVPAKLGGCCALFDCRAGADAVLFADAERARTVAGTFPVVGLVCGWAVVKSKSRVVGLNGVEARLCSGRCAGPSAPPFCYGKRGQNHVSPQNSRAAVLFSPAGLARRLDFLRMLSGLGPLRGLATVVDWGSGSKVVKSKSGLRSLRLRSGEQAGAG
jgi:hypothetical protein